MFFLTLLVLTIYFEMFQNLRYARELRSAKKSKEETPEEVRAIHREY